MLRLGPLLYRNKTLNNSWIISPFCETFGFEISLRQDELGSETVSACVCLIITLVVVKSCMKVIERWSPFSFICVVSTNRTCDTGQWWTIVIFTPKWLYSVQFVLTKLLTPHFSDDGNGASVTITWDSYFNMFLSVFEQIPNEHKDIRDEEIWYYRLYCKTINLAMWCWSKLAWAYS